MRLCIRFRHPGGPAGAIVGTATVANREAWDAEAARPRGEQEPIGVDDVRWELRPDEGALDGDSWAVRPCEVVSSYELPTPDQVPMFDGVRP